MPRCAASWTGGCFVSVFLWGWGWGWGWGGEWGWSWSCWGGVGVGFSGKVGSGERQGGGGVDGWQYSGSPRHGPDIAWTPSAYSSLSFTGFAIARWPFFIPARHARPHEVNSKHHNNKCALLPLPSPPPLAFLSRSLGAGASSENGQQFALLCIGELGRRADLSSFPKLPEVLTSALANDAVAEAASLALGGEAGGCARVWRGRHLWV
jgi:hypothetical protein